LKDCVGSSPTPGTKWPLQVMPAAAHCRPQSAIIHDGAPSIWSFIDSAKPTPTVLLMSDTLKRDIPSMSFSMTLANAMPQIVWTANPDGWLDYYNDHWVAYTGMSVEQTQGWGWEPVLHPDDLQRCVDVWKYSVDTGEPYEIEYRFRRASDGSYRWHLGRALPVRDGEGKILKWFGTCTDIQDQKDAVDAVERTVIERTLALAEANGRLQAEIDERQTLSEKLRSDAVRLNQIIDTQAELARAGLELNAFFELVITRVGALTQAAGVVLELVEGAELVYRAASGVASPQIGLRLKIASSLSGLSVTNSEVLHSRDTETDRRVNIDACRLMGIRSMVVSPLFHNDKTIGVLKIMGALPDAFDQSHLQTLQLMAGLLGAAIGHQAAFDAKQRLLDDLAKTTEISKSREARTRAIIASANNAFIAVDDRGLITDWNRQSEAIFGWSHAEAMGQPMAELIIPERLRAAHHEGMRRFAATGGVIPLNRRAELDGLRRGGTEFPVELTINSIKSGARLEFFAFLHDITERKETEAKLLRMAQNDSLTGLPNRALFNDRLEHSLELSRRTGSGIALAYLDIDDFKAINDNYGHAVGDAVLQEFARRLSASVRSADTVARLGGDEFVLLLEDLSSDADVSLVSAKVLDNVRKPALLLGRALSFTASMGGTVCHGGKNTAEALLTRADHALYEVKRNGKNAAHWDGAAAGVSSKLQS
jgi:diguanylate cyclase (GGDEF)-like protein/PAS domain S-box-containing protein